MGEISDMMIGGEYCQCCGAFIGDDVGYPRYCSDCEGDRGVVNPSPAKVKCLTCGKQVKAIGLIQHMRDKHGK